MRTVSHFAEDDMDNEDGRVRAGSSGCNQVKVEFCENLQERKILQYFRYVTRDPEGDKLQHEIMAVKLREPFIFNDFVYKINIRQYRLLVHLICHHNACFFISIYDKQYFCYHDSFPRPILLMLDEYKQCLK